MINAEAQILSTFPITGDDVPLKKQMVRAILSLADENERLREQLEAVK